MTVLGAPIPRGPDQVRRWRAVMAAADIDVQRVCIGPTETALAPTLAVRLRASTLVASYGGDYNTDVFDVARLARLVESGCERITFWGPAEQVATVRRWLQGRQRPADDDLDAMTLGTETIRRAEDHFGSGSLEMCRTGSRSSTVHAAGPIVWDVLQLFTPGAAPDRSVVLCALPRNRVAQPGLRGGAGIHRLHVRTLGSSFWGWAPWYVVTGEDIEVLDYREIYFRPNETCAAIVAGRLWLGDDDEAGFATDLLELNLGARRDVARLAPRNTRSPTMRWQLRYPSGPERVRHEPAVVQAEPNGEFGDLDDCLNFAATLDAPCVAVAVRIDKPSSAGIQRKLHGRGFRLTMISPPKRRRDGRLSVRDWHGIWNNPRPGTPLAPPAYLGSALRSASERRLTDYLSSVLGSWS